MKLLLTITISILLTISFVSGELCDPNEDLSESNPLSGVFKDCTFDYNWHEQNLIENKFDLNKSIEDKRLRDEINTNFFLSCLIVLIILTLIIIFFIYHNNQNYDNV